MSNKELALKLYKASECIKLSLEDTAVLWSTIFSKDELVELWIDLDIPYNDELYNALHIVHGYFD